MAGVNRPKDPKEFTSGNIDLTEALCKAVAASRRQITIVYTSSIQAEVDNAYGASKLGAESALLELANHTGVVVRLFRLPNVFGKWSRPNYNSAVSTFCHNIANGLPIQINDPTAHIALVYIDDVIRSFMAVMDGTAPGGQFVEIEPTYRTTVGALSETIHGFRASRDTLMTDTVGNGLNRALYSTYLSYISPDNFTYEVPKYSDPRGVFVEMLKTPDAGQFSYFTAHPGLPEADITIIRKLKIPCYQREGLLPLPTCYFA